MGWVSLCVGGGGGEGSEGEGDACVCAFESLLAK